MDRKKAAGGQTPKPSRRTPVQAPGGGNFNWMPVAIGAAVIAIVALVAYLIFQASGDGGENLSASDKAEQDASSSLPGVFYPSQGRGHFNQGYPRDGGPLPFCPGVESSDQGTPVGGESGSATAQPTQTVRPTSTPRAGETPDAEQTPNTTPTVPADCYSSNPPSSGQHIEVLGNIEISDGIILPRIPPDPNVYPEDVIIPREAIPHILEHSGVFLGYNCEEGDQACADVVQQLTDLVNDRIDNFDDRVVMGNDPDLPEGTIGVVSWTRALNMTVDEFDIDAVEKFISTHSCRFDPEGFCG